MSIGQPDDPASDGANGLRIASLVTGYQQQPAVHGVSLDVPAKRFGAIIGPNGAGKSSLLRAVAGVNKVWRGQLFWRGEEITALSAAGRVERGVCVVLQGAPAFPRLSVDENLRVGARITARAQVSIGEIYDLFPELAGRRRQLARDLSGGERQMLALARAICAGPSLLLVDEPSFGLAVGVRYRLLAMIEDFRQRFDWTVLMAEQDVSMVSKADPVYYMASGRCERMGTQAAAFGESGHHPSQLDRAGDEHG